MVRKYVKNKRISYEEYRNKPGKKSDDSLVIFVSAFFIMLLLFLAVAKHLSPEVDVTIGVDNRFEDDDRSVDNRLKDIQEADKSMEIKPTKTDEAFSPELDEKVLLPTKNDATLFSSKKEPEKPKLIETKQEIKEKEEAMKKQEAGIEQSAVKSSKTAKVVIGTYANEEQAKIAKDIILEAGLNIHPFIRSVGGSYTIQAGSFSTRNNAQVLVDELLKHNYPARIIME